MVHYLFVCHEMKNIDETTGLEIGHISTSKLVKKTTASDETSFLVVSGQIQEEQRQGHPQCHHSPGHLTTMVFSNDPRYGSHLAGDQGQLSIYYRS
jgi:hypothetical protein